MGRSEEEDESMMKQHARESCEDESMMKQHVISYKSSHFKTTACTRVLCWLSAGPWRLALGGRTWIVDRVECDLTWPMRVPFTLFAFALVRLALVRAVAFNI